MSNVLQNTVSEEASQIIRQPVLSSMVDNKSPDYDKI